MIVPRCYRWGGSCFKAHSQAELAGRVQILQKLIKLLPLSWSAHCKTFTPGSKCHHPFRLIITGQVMGCNVLLTVLPQAPHTPQMWEAQGSHSYGSHYSKPLCCQVRASRQGKAVSIHQCVPPEAQQSIKHMVLSRLVLLSSLALHTEKPVCLSFQGLWFFCLAHRDINRSCLKISKLLWVLFVAEANC